MSVITLNIPARRGLRRHGFDRGSLNSQWIRKELKGHLVARALSAHLNSIELRDDLQLGGKWKSPLAKEDKVESAFALVEGFVLLDSRAWQRPSYFRAFNTENEGQVRALEEMLDRDEFPNSAVDFNPSSGWLGRFCSSSSQRRDGGDIDVHAPCSC